MWKQQLLKEEKKSYQMATVGSKESVESNRSSITMIAALFGEEAAVRSKTVTTATTTVTATATPAWELFVGLPERGCSATANECE